MNTRIYAHNLRSYAALHSFRRVAKANYHHVNILAATCAAVPALAVPQALFL